MLNYKKKKMKEKKQWNKHAEMKRRGKKSENAKIIEDSGFSQGLHSRSSHLAEACELVVH